MPCCIEVITLIEQKTGKSYDQAIEHLTDLRDLARHQGEEVAFQARLNNIHQQYRHLTGLKRRLNSANLHEL